MNATHLTQTATHDRHRSLFLLQLALLIAALILWSTARAGATEFIPMADRDLADRAAVIAAVTVESIAPGPDHRLISTEYLVQVEKVIKGNLPGSSIVLRVPGGVRADGVGLKIWGAPSFAPGEQAIVFLLPNRDGSFAIEGLMLGAFHVRSTASGTLALRDLSEAHSVSLASSPTESLEEPLRDTERFAGWLSDRASGVVRAADYRVAPPSGPRSATDAFTQLGASDGKNVRWFSFDGGQTARWFSHTGGQPGLSESDTNAAFAAALSTWTDDPTSTINYSYSGSTQASAGLHGNDGVNAILFNDPSGDVPGTLDCTAGGVVAMGGPFFYNSLRDFHGSSYHEAFEGDVVTNDGAQCFFQDNPSGAAEVFAHELGHTLGFGHSSDRQALMYSHAHNDGRGAGLGTDDRIGASAIYGDGSYQGSTAPPPPPPPPPSTTPTVSASAGATSTTCVRVSWSHNLPNARTFEVQVLQTNGTYSTVGSTQARGRSFDVRGLSANRSYQFRVRAVTAADPILSNVARARTRTR